MSGVETAEEARRHRREAVSPAGARAAAGPGRRAADHPYAANRLRISIVDLTFAIWAIVIPLLLPGHLLNTDGDAGRHLRMGAYILSGGFDQPDIFSHTKFGAPFLTTEWLSQVWLALAHRAGGLAGVAIASGLLIAACYAVLILFLRRKGVDPLLAYIAGLVAAVLGWIHWLARPHLFTFAGLALLLFVLEGRGRRRVLGTAVLFAAWSNFHPGFVLGLAALGAYLAGDLLEAVTSAVDRAEWLGRARYHGAALVSGLVGSCVNPQGPGFFVRIFRHLGDATTTGTIEFMSLDFRTFYGATFIAVLAVIMTILAFRERRPAYPRLAVLCLMLAGALYSARIVPLFGLLIPPVLALEWDAAWRSIRWPRLARVRETFMAGERIAVPGRWIAVPLMLMIALGVRHGSVGGAQIVPDRFDATVFPAAAIEKARAAGLSGNMFNEFEWGGYIIYAWPEQRVFIDGMTDFFGADITNEYQATYAMLEGWDARLRDRDISLVIVRPTTALASALAKDHGWRTWYADSIAVVLQRIEPRPDPADP